MAYVLPTLRCLRCGYDWIPRIRRVTICPRCKSTLWDKPKEPTAGEHRHNSQPPAERRALARKAIRARWRKTREKKR